MTESAARVADKLARCEKRAESITQLPDLKGRKPFQGSDGELMEQQHMLFQQLPRPSAALDTILGEG